MDLDIFEVLEKAAKQRTKAKKVEVLKQNESWPLKDVIRGSYDSTIKWDLTQPHQRICTQQVF